MRHVLLSSVQPRAGQLQQRQREQQGQGKAACVHLLGFRLVDLIGLDWIGLNGIGLVGIEFCSILQSSGSDCYKHYLLSPRFALIFALSRNLLKFAWGLRGV